MRIKTQIYFLLPRSGPAMTFCCCCSIASVGNAFPMDLGEQRQDSASVQPGRPRQPQQGQTHPARKISQIQIARGQPAPGNGWGAHTVLGSTASSQPASRALQRLPGYKITACCYIWLTKTFPLFLLPLQRLKHHIQVTP